MLKKSAYLESVFGNVEVKPVRDGYGEGLVEIGKRHKNVVVLTADLKESTRCHWFADEFPDRFIDVGVAEQNMAAVAAGLGISGKIPFISSYAVFSPGRNWEQIRTVVCYNDSNVKIAGHHAGLSTGPDGATHQALEDIALMRTLPNMKVVVPADAVEARKATEAAAEVWGPVYLRLTRPATPVVTTGKTPFVLGRAELLWTSRKPVAAIFACGRLVYDALLAAEELDREGVRTLVYNSHTAKPIDEKAVCEAAERAGALVTVEEHSVIGGLGSAVSEVTARKCQVPVQFVGTRDVFGESGEPNELLEKYGLDKEHIKEAVRQVIDKA